MAVVAARMRDSDGLTVMGQAHEQAIHTSAREAARIVLDTLGGALAAYVLGVKDRKTMQRWAAGAIVAIRPEHEVTLRGVLEIIVLLSRFEGPETVRAWFLGMAPELDDIAPARAVHDGLLPQAMNAARAFIAHG